MDSQKVTSTYRLETVLKEHFLNLITHVDVEPAHKSDANAVVLAIESVEERNLKPKELMADSLYGSDDNCEIAEKHNVELIVPTMGSVEKEKLSISDKFHIYISVII